MKIEDNRIKYVDFFTIQCGECFIYDGDYYMKVFSQDYNAVSFFNSHLVGFYDDEEVIPVNAKIIIE